MDRLPMQRWRSFALVLAGMFVLNACSSDSPPSRHGLGLHRAATSDHPGWIRMSYERSELPYWVEPRARLDEYDLDSAEALFDESGQPVVLLTFNPEGRNDLERLTRGELGQPLAILVDGQLRLAPLVEAPIDDGRIVISGFRSAEEALRLAGALQR
ncbi:SecDF P1 head subdomain-containing protein [Pseudomonas sp. LRF_L74]|uniref:SecDF P1 head subdomain-containing protein n=1 Tax=Pseudomonas sp. LRF_L74 TaxID=3369422 RepID=UPI003F618B08